MNKHFTKEQIFTIPNLLTLIRLLLIPVIVYLYIVPRQYYLAAGLTVLSAATDILDGWIARRFHMVSDVGKFIDPVADKLTQAALMICVYTHYPSILWLFILFAVKELYMLIWGTVLLARKDTMSYALWHGKLNTVLLLSTLGLLVLFPSISQNVAQVLFVVCGVSIVFSSAMYTRFYINMMKR